MGKREKGEVVDVSGRAQVEHVEIPPGVGEPKSGEQVLREGGRRMMRLPCPHGGCQGVEVCDGKIVGCGHPTMTSATADCPWTARKMPECAVDRDEEGAVWIEIVDGVTESIPVATELAEHLEGEDGWELRFDAIVTMQRRDRDGEEWWVETTEPREDARQFWRFEYWEAKRARR